MEVGDELERPDSSQPDGSHAGEYFLSEMAAGPYVLAWEHAQLRRDYKMVSRMEIIVLRTVFGSSSHKRSASQSASAMIT